MSAVGICGKMLLGGVVYGCFGVESGRSDKGEVAGSNPARPIGASDCRFLAVDARAARGWVAAAV